MLEKISYVIYFIFLSFSILATADGYYTIRDSRNFPFVIYELEKDYVIRTRGVVLGQISKNNVNYKLLVQDTSISEEVIDKAVKGYKVEVVPDSNAEYGFKVIYWGGNGVSYEYTPDDD